MHDACTGSVDFLELQQHPLEGPRDAPDHHLVSRGGAAGIRRCDHHLVPHAALMRVAVAVGHANVLKLGAPVQIVNQHGEAPYLKRVGSSRHVGVRRIHEPRGRCACDDDDNESDEGDGSE
jgi:hypothetical protein